MSWTVDGQWHLKAVVDNESGRGSMVAGSFNGGDDGQL